MSKLGLVLIVITAISVAAAIQASYHYFIQAADAQPRLPNNSVRSESIVDGEVNTQDLADDAVTSEKISDGEVTSADIADGSIQIHTDYRLKDFIVPAGQFEITAVSCQEGERYTGGGFNLLWPELEIRRSNPGVTDSPTDPGSWIIGVRNHGSVDREMVVFVMCAKIVS